MLFDIFLHCDNFKPAAAASIVRDLCFLVTISFEPCAVHVHDRRNNSKLEVQLWAAGPISRDVIGQVMLCCFIR